MNGFKFLGLTAALWMCPGLIALAQPTKICTASVPDAIPLKSFQNSSYCERPEAGISAEWQYLPRGMHATHLQTGQITAFPTKPAPGIAWYTTPLHEPPRSAMDVWPD